MTAVPRARRWRRTWFCLLPAVMLASGAAAVAQAQAQEQVGPARAEVMAAMQRATKFMAEKVAYRGGYLWNYLPDLSRRWGEMEARETMIWLQPPGTSSMGHVFLDAWHATGDDYY
jgi:hypothetical protein